MDNVFIERWRSLKYESVFLNAFETGSEAESNSDVGSTTTTPIDPTRSSAAGPTTLCDAG
jgi:hypothetical protein